MAQNSLYGRWYYGELVYGGTGVGVPSSYIQGSISFSEEQGKDYIHGSILLEHRLSRYVVGDIFLEKTDKKYVHGKLDLCYTKGQYLEGQAALLARKGVYLQGRVSFMWGLLPYEVDEFQCIVTRQGLNFHWKDSH